MPAKGFQWFQCAAELELVAVAFGPPRGRDGTVGEEQECAAQWGPSRGRGQFACRGRGHQTQWSERFKRGQRDARAEPAQEVPAAEIEMAFGGDVSGVGCVHGLSCGGRRPACRRGRHLAARIWVGNFTVCWKRSRLCRRAGCPALRQAGCLPPRRSTCLPLVTTLEKVAT